MTRGNSADCTVEREEVRIRRTSSDRSEGVVFETDVSTTGDCPVAVRFAEAIPRGLESDDVRIHPESKPERTVIHGETVLFEAWVDPSEPVTVKYAVQTDDVDGRTAREPRVLDTAVLSDGEFREGYDAVTPFSRGLTEEISNDDDTDDDRTADEADVDQGEQFEAEAGSPGGDTGDEETTDGPSFGPGVSNIEPDASVPEAPLPRGGAGATDDRSGTAAPSTVGSPRPTTPDPGASTGSEPSADGSVVDAVVAELDRRELTEDERATVRSALGVDPPTHVDAKVNRLQTQVAELEAYRGSLKAFLDENGTGSEIVDDLNAQLAAVEADLDDLASEVEAVRTGARDDAERIEADLETLRTNVESDVASLREVVDGLEAQISDLEAEVSALEAEHDDDVTELRSSIEELESLQDKLSTAFGSVGGDGSE